MSGKQRYDDDDDEEESESDADDDDDLAPTKRDVSEKSRRPKAGAASPSKPKSDPISKPISKAKEDLVVNLCDSDGDGGAFSSSSSSSSSAASFDLNLASPPRAKENFANSTTTSSRKRNIRGSKGIVTSPPRLGLPSPNFNKSVRSFASSTPASSRRKAPSSFSSGGRNILGPTSDDCGSPRRSLTVAAAASAPVHNDDIIDFTSSDDDGGVQAMPAASPQPKRRRSSFQPQEQQVGSARRTTKNQRHSSSSYFDQDDAFGGGAGGGGRTNFADPFPSGADASAGHHPTMPDRWSTGTDRRRKLRDATASSWSGVMAPNSGVGGSFSTGGSSRSRPSSTSMPRPDVWATNNEEDAARTNTGRAKSTKKRSTGRAGSATSASSFVQVGGESGDVWYRQGTGSASASIPTQRNDISGGAGAGIGGFVIGGHDAPSGETNHGGDFVLEEGDSLTTFGDDYDRPPIQAEHRGKRGGRGGGGRKWGRGKRKYRGGGGGGKRRGKGRKKAEGSRNSQSNSSSAWSAKEAEYHSYGDDIGGGATMNF